MSLLLLGTLVMFTPVLSVWVALSSLLSPASSEQSL